MYAVRTARIIQCSRGAWENKAVSNIYFRSAMRVSEAMREDVSSIA